MAQEEVTDTTDTTALDAKVSKIDQMIAAAAARKAAKSRVDGTLTMDAKQPDASKAPVDAAARKAKQAEIAKAREEKRAAREAVKAKKEAERAASHPLAHMGKVNKAAAKLPTLAPSEVKAYDELIAKFSTPVLSAIALHIQHFVRAQATASALTFLFDSEAHGNSRHVISRLFEE